MLVRCCCVSNQSSHLRSNAAGVQLRTFTTSSVRRAMPSSKSSTSTASSANTDRRFVNQQTASSSSSSSTASRANSNTTTTTLQQRWKNMSSFSEFHEKVLNTIRGSTTQQQQETPTKVALWRRIILWTFNNAAGILSYQMLLEGLVSATIAGLLMNKIVSLEGMKQYMVQVGYPFESWIDWEGGVYEKGIEFPASMKAMMPLPKAGSNKEHGVILEAEACTALHSGHNVSMGLMPLQLVFMAATYPLVVRAWPSVRSGLSRVPMVGYVFRPIAMPAEAASAINRVVGSSLGGAAVTGSGASAGAAAANMRRNSSTWKSKQHTN